MKRFPKKSPENVETIPQLTLWAISTSGGSTGPTKSEEAREVGQSQMNLPRGTTVSCKSGHVTWGNSHSFLNIIAVSLLKLSHFLRAVRGPSAMLGAILGVTSDSSYQGQKGKDGFQTRWSPSSNALANSTAGTMSDLRRLHIHSWLQVSKAIFTVHTCYTKYFTCAFLSWSCRKHQVSSLGSKFLWSVLHMNCIPGGTLLKIVWF